MEKEKKDSTDSFIKSIQEREIANIKRILTSNFEIETKEDGNGEEEIDDFKDKQ